MPRQSKDKTKFIKYAFPRDYVQLDSILSVDEKSMTLNLNTYEEFCVHPEYDLPYKLLSMIYSEAQNHRINAFNELYRKKKGTVEDELYFHTKNNHVWNDYMFQFPGIFDLFGIKRSFHLGYSMQQIDVIPINNENSIIDMIQSPILFLILIYLKIYDGAFFTDDIIEMINKSVIAYENKEKCNSFNREQLQDCYDFLVRDSRNTGFNAWLGDNKVSKIEIKVERIVENFLHNNKETKDFSDEEEKGAVISFPKYMRTILLGIHSEIDFFKSFSPLLFNQTLWSKVSMKVPPDIESETAETFYRFVMLLYYRSNSGKLIDFFRNEEMKYLNNKQKEEVSADVTEKLIRYYTFCIYTLYKISCEDKNYKALAQDTFERLFSLYLFNVETELLFKRVEELAERKKESHLTEIQKFNTYLDLTRYVISSISDEGLHAIYCSPGIFHRVSMVNYIVNSGLSVDMQHELYSVLHSNLTDVGKYDEQVLQEISNINKKYYAFERYCIDKCFCNKKGITKDDIIKKYNEYKECKEYYEYYDNLYLKIRNVKNNNFTRHDASKIAEEMISKIPAEKRLLHFWVIFYSFLSEDSLFKVDRFE